jgi:hypothetical protein
MKSELSKRASKKKRIWETNELPLLLSGQQPETILPYQQGKSEGTKSMENGSSKMEIAEHAEHAIAGSAGSAGSVVFRLQNRARNLIIGCRFCFCKNMNLEGSL